MAEENFNNGGKPAERKRGNRSQLAAVDIEKRSRRGPAPLPTAEKRCCTASVRLNRQEADQLDRLCAEVRMKRGEYLRAATLHKLPPSIPELNRQAWIETSRIASNLNQYQLKINEGLAFCQPPELLAELRDALDQLRRALIGA